jgi:predicted RND superfamily exporter protein
LSAVEAKRRLERLLLGADLNQTCAVAFVSERGSQNREGALDFVYECAAQVEGLSANTLRVAGPTIESVAINRASQDSMSRYLMLSVVVALVVSYICLRSLRLALMVFLTAMFSNQLSMAIIYYAGSRMDSVSNMIPALVYVLSISSGIHLVNYYQDAIRDGAGKSATERAVGHAWKPCLLSALTTALGLISLGVSNLIPIQRFATFGAVGVLAGFVVVFLLLPCLLALLPPDPRLLPARRRWVDSAKPRANGSLARFTCDFRRPILAAGIVLFGIGGWGVSRLEPTARLHDLFRQGRSRVLADYDWLEQHIGGLVPLEIVLDMPRDNPMSIVERVQLVQQLGTEVEKLPDIDRTVSAATWLPKIPSGGGVRQVVRRVVIRHELEARRSELVRTRYLQANEQREYWRVSARVMASRRVDYGQLISDVRDCVEAKVLAPLEGQVPGVTAVYSGSIPLVQKAQKQLLVDLFKSFLTAFLVITLTMTLLFRNFAAGLLSMIPNLLPCVLVFGVMGWLDIKLEVGAMMTASAAIGIAVDDTLHFTTWFRRGLGDQLSRREAVQYAFARCSRAMLQTSMICGLGLLAYAPSSFAPIARFSLSMGGMLAAALLGDLVVLPAILASPLGNSFRRRHAAADRKIQEATESS